MGASVSPARGEAEAVGSPENPGRAAEGLEAPAAGWVLGRAGRTGWIGGIPGTAVRAGTSAGGACAGAAGCAPGGPATAGAGGTAGWAGVTIGRSEEHTSELQSLCVI